MLDCCSCHFPFPQSLVPRMGSLEKHSVRHIQQADGPSRCSPRARPESVNFLEAPSEPWRILLTFRLENSADAHLYPLPYHLHTLWWAFRRHFLHQQWHRTSTAGSDPTPLIYPPFVSWQRVPFLLSFLYFKAVILNEGLH